MTETTEVIIETNKAPTHAIIWLNCLWSTCQDFLPIGKQFKIPYYLAIRFIFPHAPVQPVTLNNGIEMRAWYDITSLDRNSNQDVNGIRQSEQQLITLIQQQTEQGIPANHIFIAGFSQGGAMALHTGLRYPKKLAGIIALSTYLPLADHLKTERHNSNHQLPIFYAHGEFDPVIENDFVTTSYETLTALNYPVDMFYYPMAHTVCNNEIADLSKWITKHR